MTSLRLFLTDENASVCFKGIKKNADIKKLGATVGGTSQQLGKNEV